jgi:hypothetical protein
MGGPKLPALLACLVVSVAFILLGALPPSSLAVPIVFFCVIGFFGLSYGSLMAHARLFIPDTLIGVGVTFINFIFMGGSSVVQFLSGVFVDHAAEAGMDAAHRYALLHIAFGVALLAATAVYTRSQARPSLRKSLPEAETNSQAAA